MVHVDGRALAVRVDLRLLRHARSRARSGCTPLLLSAANRGARGRRLAHAARGGIEALQRETVSAGVGLGRRRRVRRGPVPVGRFWKVKVERDDFGVGVWLRRLIFQTEIDAERLRVAALKLVAAVPDEKRSGMGVARLLLKERLYDPASNVGAVNPLRQARFLAASRPRSRARPRRRARGARRGRGLPPRAARQPAALRRRRRRRDRRPVPARPRARARGASGAATGGSFSDGFTERAPLDALRFHHLRRAPPPAAATARVRGCGRGLRARARLRGER